MRLVYMVTLLALVGCRTDNKGEDTSATSGPIAVDDDAIGAMLRDTGVSYITAEATDDYDGVAHSGAWECIVEHSTEPSAHYQGDYLLSLGDETDPSAATRVGLYWDGSYICYHLDGVLLGSVADALDVDGAGLSSFASQGNPGAELDYLWIGSEPIDFNPEDLSTSAVVTVGAEEFL